MGKLEKEVTSYIMWLVATFILTNNCVMLKLSCILRTGTNVRFRNTDPEQKVKIKCTLVQALRLCTGRTPHRGSRGIALLFHDHGTRRRPGRSLPPGKTRYPLYRRLGGPHGRSGQVRKISPPLGFGPRTV